LLFIIDRFLAQYENVFADRRRNKCGHALKWWTCWKSGAIRCVPFAHFVRKTTKFHPISVSHMYVYIYFIFSRLWLRALFSQDFTSNFDWSWRPPNWTPRSCLSLSLSSLFFKLQIFPSTSLSSSLLSVIYMYVGIGVYNDLIGKRQL